MGSAGSKTEKQLDQSVHSISLLNMDLHSSSLYTGAFLAITGLLFLALLLYAMKKCLRRDIPRNPLPMFHQPMPMTMPMVDFPLRVRVNSGQWSRSRFEDLSEASAPRSPPRDPPRQAQAPNRNGPIIQPNGRPSV